MDSIYITPIIMLVIGTLLKYSPCKNISKAEGYSTPTSRKSIEVWKRAQKIAPDLLIKYSIALGVFIIIMQLLASESYITKSQLKLICTNLWVVTFPIYFIHIEMKIKTKRV